MKEIVQSRILKIMQRLVELDILILFLEEFATHFYYGKWISWPREPNGYESNSFLHPAS
jgi:hypothetical protein